MKTIHSSIQASYFSPFEPYVSEFFFPIFFQCNDTNNLNLRFLQTKKTKNMKVYKWKSLARQGKETRWESTTRGFKWGIKGRVNGRRRMRVNTHGEKIVRDKRKSYGREGEIYDEDIQWERRVKTRWRHKAGTRWGIKEEVMVKTVRKYREDIRWI